MILRYYCLLFPFPFETAKAITTALGKQRTLIIRVPFGTFFHTVAIPSSSKQRLLQQSY
jgi:hypothetical protein